MVHRATRRGEGGIASVLLTALVSYAATANAAVPNSCADKIGNVIEMRGAVVEDGQAGMFKRRIELGSGRSREMIDLGIIKRGSGFDGTLGWSQDVSGGTHDLNSDFARALTTSQAWLDARQSCPPGAGSGWTSLGRKAEGAKEFDAWRVTPAGGAPIELWYDPGTHRLDRAFFQQAETRLVRHFADWREVDRGHLIAFTERDEFVEDQSEVTFHVALVVVEPAAGRGAFARPADPHDARIRGGKGVTEIPYADDHRTRIYVPVYLNGRGPFTFELDNGGHFILDAPTAKVVGLSPEGTFSSTGAGNAVARVGFVRVHELRIGDAIISDTPAKVRSFSRDANDRGPQPPRAGILGLELFERFTVAIDRRRKVVNLRLRGTPYPKPGGQPVPLIFEEDAPLIRGAVGGLPGNLMMDTGNAGATIVEHFWAQKNGLVKQLGSGLSDGEVRYSLGVVEVGPIRLAGETLSYYGPAERGSEYTRSVAAILGEPLLSRFDATYDYSRNLVWLNPVDGIGVLPFGRSGLLLEKLDDGNFAVYSTVPGSPAAQAGLKKGDVVSAIAGKASRLLSRADVGSIFRQAPGTSVDLTVVSSGSQPHAIQITLRDLLRP